MAGQGLEVARGDGDFHSGSFGSGFSSGVSSGFGSRPCRRGRGRLAGETVGVFAAGRATRRRTDRNGGAVAEFAVEKLLPAHVAHVACRQLRKVLAHQAAEHRAIGQVHVLPQVVGGHAGGGDGVRQPDHAFVGVGMLFEQQRDDVGKLVGASVRHRLLRLRLSLRLGCRHSATRRRRQQRRHLPGCQRGEAALQQTLQFGGGESGNGHVVGRRTAGSAANDAGQRQRQHRCCRRCRQQLAAPRHGDDGCVRVRVG